MSQHSKSDRAAPLSLFFAVVVQLRIQPFADAMAKRLEIFLVFLVDFEFVSYIICLLIRGLAIEKRDCSSGIKPWNWFYPFFFKEVFMQSHTKNLIRYVVPSAGGLFVTYLYNVVDGIFVGQGVGTQALGAVNIGVFCCYRFSTISSI